MKDKRHVSSMICLDFYGLHFDIGNSKIKLIFAS